MEVLGTDSRGARKFRALGLIWSIASSQPAGSVSCCRTMIRLLLSLLRASTVQDQETVSRRPATADRQLYLDDCVSLEFESEH